MSKAKFPLKVIMAVLSLLLTVLVWQKGLEDSFDRPSVTPRITLMQREMAVLASSSLREPIQEVFVGADPEFNLLETLKGIPLNEMKERERIMLALLESSEERKNILLEKHFDNQQFDLIKQSLSNSLKRDELSKLNFAELKRINLDPLLYQLSCLKLGGFAEQCINQEVSFNRAIRLVVSQSLPFLASVFGIIFLIKKLWDLLVGEDNPWPPLFPLPLSILDMILLVAGGFVVIGEVLFPAIIVPLSDLFLSQIQSPLKDSLKVLIGYGSMTIAPLFILRSQLRGIHLLEIPLGGWIQWRLNPVAGGAFQALRGWLMVMPLVLLTGWIMNLFFGDQGGSNPLLDLVLSSHDFLSLALLFITTVVFAPLFEELVFRGVLLPVLVEKIGRFGGVFLSALVFALAHLSVGELPPLFVLGVGLGLLRLTSGRLFPCALMHSIWNGVTFSSLLLVGL